MELPDNANLPVVNQPQTILGFVITFLLLAFVAISLRLHVRLKAGLWGWDDVFVLFAGAATLVGSSLTCLMPQYGLGKHFYTLDPFTKMQYFKYIWSTNVTYTASTTFIKLSILFQYRRLFNMQDKRARVARTITWCMIGITGAWGFTFFCLALFSCRPIAKNWNFTLPGTCVAWGSKNPNIFFATWAAHAASNMLLDILVLLVPIPFLRCLKLHGKTRLGLIGLFGIGGIVVTLSVARMAALSVKRAGTVPIFDVSFYTPSIYIFSVLEINIAIVCASIPIFWPLVTSLAANKILVVNEIEVRTDRRGSQPSIGLVEQGYNSGFGAIPDFDLEDMDKGGRTSRMSVLVTGKGGAGQGEKLARPACRSKRPPERSYQRHQHAQSGTSASISSNKSTHIPIETDLGRRVSQESQQNLNLAHQPSNGALSQWPSSTHTPPELPNPFGDASRNGSSHYQDRYVQDWVMPDFETGEGHGNTSGAVPTGTTTTVERAEIPFDHIKALER